MKLNAEGFYQTRSLRATLGQGFSLYVSHVWPLTRPLLRPVFLQVAGILLALVIPFTFIDWVSGHPITESKPLLWGLCLLSIMPGLGLFSWSFWEYLLWVSALNLVARDCVELGVCGDTPIYKLRVAQRSQDYSLLWVFFFALAFLPLGLGALTLGLAEAFHWGTPTAILLSILVTGALSLGALGIGVLCALVFQVFAFTPGSAGASLFRSGDLVKLSPGKTVLLLLITGILTQGLLPTLGLGVCDTLTLPHLLGKVLLPGVSHILETNYQAWQVSGMLSEPGAQLFQLLLRSPLDFATEIARTALISIFSALLLPLSTMWLALWYGHLKTQQDGLAVSQPEGACLT